jgi:hypothetical protein
MAENKKSFLLYTDVHFTVKKLTNEQAGILFKHILSYVNDENPITNDTIIDLVFEPIKQALKRDLRKYEGIIKERSYAGRLGGVKSGEVRRNKKEANEANALKRKQTKQRQANEAVNDIVIDNVNDIVIEKKIRRRTPFKAPTIEEVIQYFDDNGYEKEAAEKAFKYYDVANWFDSKGNAILNWKQKMQSVWFKEENKKRGLIVAM